MFIIIENKMIYRTRRCTLFYTFLCFIVSLSLEAKCFSTENRNSANGMSIKIDHFYDEIKQETARSRNSRNKIENKNNQEWLLTRNKRIFYDKAIVTDLHYSQDLDKNKLKYYEMNEAPNFIKNDRKNQQTFLKKKYQHTRNIFLNSSHKDILTEHGNFAILNSSSNSITDSDLLLKVQQSNNEIASLLPYNQFNSINVESDNYDNDQSNNDDVSFVKRYRRNVPIALPTNSTLNNSSSKTNQTTFNTIKLSKAISTLVPSTTSKSDIAYILNDKQDDIVQQNRSDRTDSDFYTTQHLTSDDNDNDNNQQFTTIGTSLSSTVYNYNENYTCDENEDENCYIDHNVTCVGDPLYCNLTYDQYMELLYDYIYPTTPEWILIISHGVVFVMGLVGNALVCIAVYTNHSMRTVTNIFIVNLAVADFFVILFCLPPTVVWDVTETWFMGKAMCKVVLYFQTVSVTVSVLTLTFISIDRWYAICFPLRYVSTNERAIGSIAFIWIVALLSDLPEFLVLTTKRKQLRFGSNLFTQCVATWDKETEKNFYIVRIMMLYMLPLLLMTVAYFQIVRVLWKSDTIPGHRESRNHQQYTCACKNNKSNKNMRNTCGQSSTPNPSTMGQLRARRKAAKMLVAVVIMFASCYFPVHVLNVLRYTIDIGQSEVIAVLSLFSHWLCYANSAVNPVIYNFMSGKFRREFKNALEKCSCVGSSRGRVEDRSMYHSAPGTRINNISPSSRSNYQLTSVRDITTRQTLQTSFIENGGNGHQAGATGQPTAVNRINTSTAVNHQSQTATAVHHQHNQMTPMLLEERLAHAKIDGGP